MRLVRLLVSQVRNLADQEIALDQGLNLLVGANGQGKSSILEAVYLLGTTRSFRTSKLGEVVKIGGGPARIAGEGESSGENLAVLLSRNERQYLKNGKPVGAADYIGTMEVVALSSDIVQGFRRRPAERRRFLDRMALATYPGYLIEMRDLRRACAQRAMLAATGNDGPERQAWDERAASLALPIVRRRREMAQALERNLRETSTAIFPEGATARVRHVTRPAYDREREPRYVDELRALFAAQPRASSTGGSWRDASRHIAEPSTSRHSAGRAASRDDGEKAASWGGRGASRHSAEPPPGRRETPAGPLRDDLTVEVEGADLLRYGSAGQFRSLLTAAVLAEMNRLREIRGRFPILLLDDVDADLDEARYTALLAGLGGKAQVLAATSKPGLAVGKAGPARRLEVRDGRVSPS